MSQNEFVSFVAKWQKSSTKKKKKNNNGKQIFFGVTQLSIIQEFYDLLVYVDSMW